MPADAPLVIIDYPGLNLHGLALPMLDEWDLDGMPMRTVVHNGLKHGVPAHNTILSTDPPAPTNPPGPAGRPGAAILPSRLRAGPHPFPAAGDDMARKAKDTGDPIPVKRGRGRPKGSGSKPTTSASPPPSNVSDDVIRAHLQRVLPAHREWREKQEEAKELQGSYRALLKGAKRDGISPDAIADAIKLHQGEHREIKVRSQMTRRVLKVMESPMVHIFAEQMDLFDQQAAAAGKPALSNGSDDVAHHEGYQAGKAGRNIGINPYPKVTSAEHKAWNKGWHDGQADLCEEKFPGTKKVYDGTPGPGGDAKVKPEGAGAAP